MRARRLVNIAALGMILGALLGVDGAWAHPGVGPPLGIAHATVRDAPSSPTPSPNDLVAGVDGTDLRVAAMAAAPEASRAPWVAVVSLLILAALGRRHPRRALTLALVLLLLVFAFEDGLHSVHHGIGPGARCAQAAASAHLSATAVDASRALAVQMMSAPAPDLEPGNPASRSLIRSTGRAPPAALS